MASGRRLPRGREFPRGADDATRLPVLHPLRQRCDESRAGLGPEHLSRGVRHRGGTRRAQGPRCQRGRDVPFPRLRAETPARTRPRRPLLLDLRHFQGSRRQRVAAPGDQDAASRARVTGAACGEPILDVSTLTELLREAEKRHGQYEPTAPKHHWSGWYAAYVIARERGKTSDEAFKEATLHIEGS